MSHPLGHEGSRASWLQALDLEAARLLPAVSSDPGLLGGQVACSEGEPLLPTETAACTGPCF